MMFNGGLIPFYLLIQSLHMMDTVWALVILWAVPAYELMLLKNYFENVPNEVYEAAGDAAGITAKAMFWSEGSFKPLCEYK